MKRNNKKGFTIVELVIVIAVIAILAGIMIPTFGSVVKNANESARDQEAKSIYTTYTANIDYASGDEPITDGYIVVDGYLYTLTNGNVVVDNEQSKADVPDGYVLVDGQTNIYQEEN